ncbi:MAG: putative membrane protein [Parvicellaceae bacterium]|jgi:uncharacterized membrane protein
MEHLYPILKTLHIVAGCLWFGEMVIIVFILNPALKRDADATKDKFVLAVYRRIYNMSSVSIGILWVTGIYLLYPYFDYFLSNEPWSNGWRMTMESAMILTFLLTVLHFFEKRSIIKFKRNYEREDFNRKKFVRRMIWMPTFSLTGVSIVFLLMLSILRNIY